MPLPCVTLEAVFFPLPFSWTDTSRWSNNNYNSQNVSGSGFTHTGLLEPPNFVSPMLQRDLETVSKQIHDGHKSEQPNCHAFGTMPKPGSFHRLGQLLRQHQEGLRQPSSAWGKSWYVWKHGGSEEVRDIQISWDCYFSLSEALVGMLIQSSTCFTEIKSCICMILLLGFGVQEWFYRQHQYLVISLILFFNLRWTIPKSQLSENFDSSRVHEFHAYL